jgi:hypothetical protein
MAYVSNSLDRRFRQVYPERAAHVEDSQTERSWAEETDGIDKKGFELEAALEITY